MCWGVLSPALRVGLSKLYFLYGNKTRLLQNSGSIGLSRMVLLIESYLQHLEYKAIAKVLTIPYNGKHVKDMYTAAMLPFHQNIKQTLLQTQYTIEDDNGSKSLNFLEININNTINNKYEFKVHRKKAITNIHIKPTSCIDPNTIKSKFKGFLHREHWI